MELVYDDKSHRDLIFRCIRIFLRTLKSLRSINFDVIYPKKSGAHGMGRQPAERDDPSESVPHEKFQIRNLTAHYIVAVATRKEIRRQGIMRKMLHRVLNDMAERGEPFTYLIPADKAYYEPFDFVFVMDWTEIEITGEAGAVTESLESFQEAETQEVLRFLNRQIRSYDIYTVIDPEYLQQAAKEAKSQDGDLMVFREHGEITGVFCIRERKRYHICTAGIRDRGKKIFRDDQPHISRQ